MVALVLVFYMAFWFLLRGVSCWVWPCSLFSYFCLFVFCFFCVVFTSLGKERTVFYTSRAFVHLSCMRCFQSFSLFLLVSGIGCGLCLWTPWCLTVLSTQDWRKAHTCTSDRNTDFIMDHLHMGQNRQREVTSINDTG